MRINVVGWYGERNAGDEAFRAVFEKYLGTDHTLTFTKDPVAAHLTDRTIFGGGGVMQGGYFDALPPIGPLFAQSHEIRPDFDPYRPFFDQKRPLYGLGVDIALNGPPWDRMRSFNFQEIYTRSREYAILAQRQGMSQVRYCPDLVFGLTEEDIPAHLPPYIEGALTSATKKKLGILLTAELLPHFNLRTEMCGALQDLRDQYDLFFIPMYFGKGCPDNFVHDKIRDDLRGGEAPIIADLEKPQAILELISRMDLVISMRFHGIIFSTIAGVPFVSIANTGKHSLFCEQEKLKDLWINLPELNAYKIHDTILHIEKNERSLQEKLRGIADDNRFQIRGVFEGVKARWF